MKKWYMIAGMMIAAVFSTQATVIEFSANEGYTAGDLNGQNNWYETAAGTFSVNTNSSGSVSIDSLGTVYKKAVYQQLLAPTQGEGASVGAALSFSRNTTKGASGAVTYFALDFTDTADYSTSANRVAVQLQRTDSGWRLQFAEELGTDTNYDNADIADESLLGFSTENADSDELWLQMTLYRGANDSSWTASCTLSNMITGQIVSSIDSGPFDLTSDFSDGVYAAMNKCLSNWSAGVTDRTVESFEVSVVPEPTTVSMFFVSSLGLILFRHIVTK
ncbi:MAG: hypothetical protein AB7E95_07460 [Kiritimatiellales bacterium]